MLAPITLPLAVRDEDGKYASADCGRDSSREDWIFAVAGVETPRW